MRHQAEKSTGKTIKVFRGMWKSYIAKRKPVKVTGTKAKPKKKSMLHRAVKKLFKRHKP
jgi:hypothetical protein